MATDLIQSNTSARIVQDILGHATYKSNPQDMQEVVMKIEKQQLIAENYRSFRKNFRKNGTKY